MGAIDADIDKLQEAYAASSGSGSGVSDHGALSGLGDHDHDQYFLHTGEVGQIVIAPNAAHNPIIAFNLEDEWKVGDMIKASFGAATTLTGNIRGIVLDYSTNVTHGDKGIIGLDVTIPATAGASTHGWLVTSSQIDDGSVNEIAWGGNMNAARSLEMIFIGMGGGTLSHANAVVNGLHVNYDGITQTAGSQLSGVRVHAPTSQTIDGGAGWFSAGAPGSEDRTIYLISSTGDVIDIDLDVMPSGSVFSVAYTVAESLTGDITVFDIDMDTNLTGGVWGIKGLHMIAPGGRADRHIGLHLEGCHTKITPTFTQATTDATPTNVALISLPGPGTSHIKGTIIAVQDDNTNRGSWDIEATFYRLSGGNAVIEGTVTQNHAKSSWGAGENATFLATGGDVVAYLQVTGVAVTNITWYIYIEHTEI